jgi:hypothetical protein
VTELSSLARRLFLEKMPFALVKTCENMGRRVEFDADSILVCAVSVRASTKGRGHGEFLMFNFLVWTVKRNLLQSAGTGSGVPTLSVLIRVYVLPFRATDNLTFG